MLKKIIGSGVVATLCVTSAIAGAPYVGGGIGVGGYEFTAGNNVNLFTGYGSKLGATKRWYLGGELGVGINSYNSFGASYNLNATVVPGYMLTDDTMLYGRTGLGFMHTPKTYSGNEHSINSAYIVGLGVQTKITKSWDFRIEETNYASNKGIAGQVNLGLVYKFD